MTKTLYSKHFLFFSFFFFHTPKLVENPSVNCMQIIMINDGDNNNNNNNDDNNNNDSNNNNSSNNNDDDWGGSFAYKRKRGGLRIES